MIRCDLVLDLASCRDRIANERLRDMDEYSVCLSGESMDSRGVRELLGELDVQATWGKGTPIRRRPGHFYSETSCAFDAPGFNLRGLLQCLANVLLELGSLGVTTIEVSALL